MTSRILPYAHTAMMQHFRDHGAKTFADHYIVRQIERAGWHTATALRIPKKIRLIPQPPYSPELNPVEHIWEEVWGNWFHNRVFPAWTKVVDTLAEGRRHLAMHPAQVRSMTNFPHFRLTS
jgi:transposase